MKRPPVDLRWRAAIALGMLLGLSPWVRSETVNVSRRLVRFDGKPAAGAKVRILSDYGYRDKPTDFEVIAGADGIFSADVLQEDSLWVGHIIVRAEGCAITCEVAVTGRRKRDPWTPVRRLGPSFKIEGRTTDAEGHPVADAKVSLVWARPEQWNAVPFNSTMTHLTTTPELIAHSASNGVWSMPGIGFVQSDHPISVRAVFEAVADKPLRASVVELRLDPDPGAESRKNISLDFRLAPPILVAGRVVNSVTGEPVAGARLDRNVIFTTLAGSSVLTDGAGRFELRMPRPLPLLSFWVYQDGFAPMTVATANREQSTSDWADTRDLRVRLRPMATVSGTLRDENGNPPEEPVELFSSYDERIDPVWNCTGEDGGSKVGADGSFNARLPAGRITVALRGPPQQMGSMFGPGLPPKNFRLEQQVDIPAAGMKGWQLKTSRTDKTN